jgi:hypothetical protein
VAMLLAPLLVSSAVVKTVPFKKNVKTFGEWTCSQPQPRVIHIGIINSNSNLIVFVVF